MTAPGDDDPDADPMSAAWEGTLDDMADLADARRQAGWDVLTVPTDTVAPEPREAGDTDRFGLVFVVPGNKAGALGDAVERGSFPAFEVYHRRVGGRVFLVVEYRDEETGQAVLVAGDYDLGDASRMVHDAADAGEFFTHHRTLDGTHLATFRHGSHEPFVPEDG